MGTRTLRAWGRPRCAHGDAPGTRAAGDVGPYHKCPRGRHAPVPPRRVWDASAGRARRPRRAARRGTRTLRARGCPCAHGDVPVDAGRRGRRPLPCDIKPTAWLFQKFPCVRQVPYRGNVQRESLPLRESHPLSDILAFYRMSPTFPMLSVCSVAAKPFCVFCAVAARHAGRRNHISLCQTCGCEAFAFRRRTRQARPSPFPGGRDKRVPPVSPPRYARPSCF